MTREAGEDLSYMGTREEAQAKCIEAWKRWCVYRQPHIGTAADHRKRDSAEREAQLQFANAAALLCWHLDRDAALSSEPSQ